MKPLVELRVWERFYRQWMHAWSCAGVRKILVFVVGLLVGSCILSESSWVWEAGFYGHLLCRQVPLVLIMSEIDGLRTIDHFFVFFVMYGVLIFIFVINLACARFVYSGGSF